ncbi:glycine zipper domain-containing protein [Candidatus Venteria ishoeyi]|uniref:glycine zipper domain-containing protein n=1 Tax=Candidatus Venteria ishoeyi TaxID=1899563 RepID=UPI0025A62C02|nr:glycine zipper domain-containing protein [Candidatus Venteria ishoeyi]MDM8548291.1 glycine zipper domain-containing protein [Candidatus Venteria ishoeyi]
MTMVNNTLGNEANVMFPTITQDTEALSFDPTRGRRDYSPEMGAQPERRLRGLQTIGQSEPAPVAKAEPSKSSLDMQQELAAIEALSNAANASGGLGSTIGGAAGAGIGTVIAPGAGTAVGGAVGGAVGSVVDYMIDSSEKDRIARKQADLKRKLIKKQQRKSNAKAMANRKARLKGIGLSLEQEALTGEQAIKNERRNTLANLMYDIGQKKAFKEQLNTSFKAKRGLI